ncbi:MAG: histidine--tRNA ligase [Terrimicrobiaceae bacterium]|nr:histidine--tRNA ligase [Terrimicrobiaceae bacterium]
MPPLPGFRDFYPEDVARRSYIQGVWRRVAGRYGFVEFDGPTLESADLYRKKNEEGAEILEQLYAFRDRGDRELALRPEMTPTLARMVAAREKHYRKPMKWFCTSNFFRHERQQKGRLREFFQFNADLLGDASPEADAELIALAIDLLREFGFGPADFVVRLSDRRAWMQFLAGRGCEGSAASAVLACVDKMEREPEDVLNARLVPLGLNVSVLREFIRAGSPEAFAPVLTGLEARGLRDFVEVDLSIVRGLAYYTGVVFEIFDRSKSLRALAGGGRYDQLVAGLSDGAVDLPAIGFGMGDVVLGHLIDEIPAASARVPVSSSCDMFVVIADELRRSDAVSLVQRARDLGWRVDFPLKAAKVGRQFQDAEALGATSAIVVGAEWPAVKWKTLGDRTEEVLDQSGLAHRLENTEKNRPASRRNET